MYFKGASSQWLGDLCESLDNMRSLNYQPTMHYFKGIPSKLPYICMDWNKVTLFCFRKWSSFQKLALPALQPPPCVSRTSPLVPRGTSPGRAALCVQNAAPGDHWTEGERMMWGSNDNCQHSGGETVKHQISHEAEVSPWRAVRTIPGKGMDMAFVLVIIHWSIG